MHIQSLFVFVFVFLSNSQSLETDNGLRLAENFFFVRRATPLLFQQFVWLNAFFGVPTLTIVYYIYLESLWKMKDYLGSSLIGT